jgi:hypothetical protein
MTDTDTAVEATDTDVLIKRWRASERRVEQIAAELAAKIDAGRPHRWQELPPQAVLADEYDVTERPLRVSRDCFYYGSRERVITVPDPLPQEESSEID